MTTITELNKEGHKVYELREAAIAEIESGTDSSQAWNAWNDAATAFGENVRRAGFTRFDLEPQASDALTEPIA